MKIIKVQTSFPYKFILAPKHIGAYVVSIFSGFDFVDFSLEGFISALSATAKKVIYDYESSSPRDKLIIL